MADLRKLKQEALEAAASGNWRKAATCYANLERLAATDTHLESQARRGCASWATTPRPSRLQPRGHRLRQAGSGPAQGHCGVRDYVLGIDTQAHAHAGLARVDPGRPGGGRRGGRSATRARAAAGGPAAERARARPGPVPDPAAPDPSPGPAAAMIEPADFREAKEMTRWAFDLSEAIRNVVMVRSVTRMSHASGNVVLGTLPAVTGKAEFRCDGPVSDPDRGPMISTPVVAKHRLQQEKLRKAAALFEDSPFNTYQGPETPELLIITSSACTLYSREAVSLLRAEGRAGILKLGTTWPLPPALLKRHLRGRRRS